MSTINERIQIIATDFFNRNISAFARAIDVKQSTLKDVAGGKLAKPGYDIIEKIINAPSLEINPTWLITGDGEMLKGKSSSGEITSDHNTGISITGKDISVNPEMSEFASLIKTRDDLIREVMSSHNEVIKAHDESIKAKDRQIDRLISLLEKKG